MSPLNFQGKNSNLRSVGSGLAGIIIGLVFVAVVLLALDYFKIIDLINFPKKIINTTEVVQKTVETKVIDDVPESLVSTDLKVDNLKNKVEFFGNEKDQSILDSPVNVPLSLQNEFKAKFPGKQITYIGTNNVGLNDSKLEGNQLNDALTTMTSVGKTDSFPLFGGIETLVDPDIERTFMRRFTMKFMSIIPIPDSKDFYVYGIDPFNSEQYLALIGRVVRGKNSKYPESLITCFNLNNPLGFDSADHSDSMLAKNKDKHLAGYLSKDSLKKFFIKGDVMGIRVSLNKQGFPIYDENGWPVVELIGDFRYAGAEKIEALFK